MLLHVRLLVETFPAELTRVRSCVRVNEQVGREGRGSLEGLATLVALKHEHE